MANLKNIGIIGSTGSIGTQTLEVISELNQLEPGSFNVVCLSCGKKTDLLEKQIRDFNVKYACVEDEADAIRLEKSLSDIGTKVFFGDEGLKTIAGLTMDILVTAIVGMRGIVPTVTAIRNGTDIALANKETLVAAGSIVMSEAAKYGVKILPVDSEHSAIFQCLQGFKREELSKIILTCSGGPFRTYKKEDLSKVTLETALNHPTWKMGGKITIDCASLMNKGLEVIEARWLYDMPVDKIEVVVHPQSIVHSMVRTRDGAVLAQLGVPSMKLPIQYALTFPDRVPSKVNELDFFTNNNLTFEKPDTERFPCLNLAYEAGRIGGSLPACMNAANEKAVSMFFKGEISFNDIPKVVSKAMESHNVISNPTLEEILEISNEILCSLRSR